MRKARAVVGALAAAVGGAASLIGSACLGDPPDAVRTGDGGLTGIATGEGGAADASVDDDGSGSSAADASIDASTVAIEAPSDIVLSSDGTRLFVASKGLKPVHEWVVGAPTARPLGTAVDTARNLAVTPNSLFYLADGKHLYEQPIDTVAPRKTCRDDASVFALVGSKVVYSRPSEAATVFTALTNCNLGAYLASTASDLVAALDDEVARYESTFDGGRIVRSAVSVSAPLTTIAEGTGSAVIALAADIDRVYWATAAEVFFATRNGTSVGKLAEGERQIRALAVTPGFVYWTTSDGGAVRRARSDGSGAATDVFGDLKSPWGLAVGTTRLFVAESGANRVSRFDLGAE